MRTAAGKGTHQVFERVLPSARTSCSFIETCSASCRAKLLMVEISSHLPGHLQGQGAPFTQLRESAQAPHVNVVIVSIPMLDTISGCSAAAPRSPAEEGKRGTPAEDAKPSVVQINRSIQQCSSCNKQASSKRDLPGLKLSCSRRICTYSHSDCQRSGGVGYHRPVAEESENKRDTFGGPYGICVPQGGTQGKEVALKRDSVRLFLP